MRIKGIDSGLAKVMSVGATETSNASSSACASKEGHWERSAAGARMWVENVAAGARATETQPSSAAADAFAAALAAVPGERWARTWAADRTMMLRMTSKRFKQAVDKLRVPTFVKLRRSFWDDVRDSTAAERLQHILTHLEEIISLFQITELDLQACNLNGQDDGIFLEIPRLAGVLAKCSSMSRLALGGNMIGEQGAERLAGVLPRSLSILDLGYNGLGAQGATSLAALLPQCPLLSYLALGGNVIGNPGTERLAGVLPRCPVLSHLYLYKNQIGDDGARCLANVMPQCRVLSHLHLDGNTIGDKGAGRLAGVLSQCLALSYLDLSNNQIGAEGEGELTRVLPQCPALSRLYLEQSDQS